MDLPKLDNSNLWDKTYSVLKEQIIRRTFKPNQKISIPELANQLGVSRTPIREALNRLETEGLIKTVSKVGTFVVAIDEKTLLDIIDTRLMLEYWVLENLPKLSSDEINGTLASMEDILSLTESTIRSSPFDSNQLAEYNLAFHLAFIRMGGNQRNTDIYQQLMNYRFSAAKSSLITQTMVETALEQHYAIIASIRTGDIALMRDAIYTHLNDSKVRLLENLKNNGGVI